MQKFGRRKTVREGGNIRTARVFGRRNQSIELFFLRTEGRDLRIKIGQISFEKGRVLGLDQSFREEFEVVFGLFAQKTHLNFCAGCLCFLGFDHDEDQNDAEEQDPEEVGPDVPRLVVESEEGKGQRGEGPANAVARNEVLIDDCPLGGLVLHHDVVLLQHVLLGRPPLSGILV